MSTNDIYVGMRDNLEIEKCLKDGLFDLVIGVFDPDKPLEPSDSFNIDLFRASDIIIKTGDKEKTELTVRILSYALKNMTSQNKYFLCTQ